MIVGWAKLLQSMENVEEFLVKMFQVIATCLTLVNYHGHK